MKSVVQAQKKHDVLMGELSSLNFSDVATVLDWLCRFQLVSDVAGVKTTPFLLLHVFFTEHGYDYGGRVFKTDEELDFLQSLSDSERDARLVIANVLGEVISGGMGVHQMVHSLVFEWRYKYRRDLIT